MNDPVRISGPDAITRETLLEIVRRFGTPSYAFDMRRMRAQADRLKNELPKAVEIFYSLKANASLGICDVFANYGLGADVASAGELATAIAAGFPPHKIFVAGPFKSPEAISGLRQCPDAIVSVDSLSEWNALSEANLQNPVVVRLRPDFGSCAVVPAGCDSRFGFTDEDLIQFQSIFPKGDLNLIGFHVFAGSQVLAADDLMSHLRREFELTLRAADKLGISPTLINLGGGFGIPYGPEDEELDLSAVGQALHDIVSQAGSARIALELGRYLVAQAGWYLTTVLGNQTVGGRPAVVVDGGVHQRADMCGLNLRHKANPPIVLPPFAKGGRGGSTVASAGRGGSTGHDSSSLSPTDVLGCLSLPDDIMAEGALLPELSAGNVLAFANAGAYGVWSSPALFHGLPLPAEVAFDGAEMHLMRDRRPAQNILADQHHIGKKTETYSATENRTSTHA